MIRHCKVIFISSRVTGGGRVRVRGGCRGRGRGRVRVLKS